MNPFNIDNVSELALHGRLHDRLAVTRMGAFAKKFPFDPKSKIPVAQRMLPVLTCTFDSLEDKIQLNQPTSIGCGAVLLSREVLALTFRLQFGPHMLYWLANPLDPAVWSVLDRWNASGHMVVHASPDQGDAAFLDSCDFELPEPLEGLRKQVRWHEQSKRPFLSAATSLLQSGLEEIATTDLPAYPTLESVQGCILCTADFNDRGRLFQADRGQRFNAIVDARGLRASEVVNVSQSSTISLKRCASALLSMRP